MINELKSRGVQDSPIPVVDGLKAFPEAIIAVFPKAKRVFTTLTKPGVPTMDVGLA